MINENNNSLYCALQFCIMTHKEHGKTLHDLLKSKGVVLKELAAYMNLHQSNLNRLLKKSTIPEHRLNEIRVFLWERYGHDIRNEFPHLPVQIPDYIPSSVDPGSRKVRKMQEDINFMKEKYLQCLEDYNNMLQGKVNFIQQYTANLQEQNKLLRSLLQQFEHQKP